jgi:hypothetical protein
MTKFNIPFIVGAAIALASPLVANAATPPTNTTQKEVSAYLTCFKVEEIVGKVGAGKVEFKGIPTPRHVCYKGIGEAENVSKTIPVPAYLTCFKVEQIVGQVGEGKVAFKGVPAPRHVCYKGAATLKF